MSFRCPAILPGIVAFEVETASAAQEFQGDLGTVPDRCLGGPAISHIRWPRWVLTLMTPFDTPVSAPTHSPENVSNPNQTTYPLFETMLRSKGLTLQPTYTCKDVASLFGVTARTVQSKVADGTIPSRQLLGGARFLPADIEEYLRNSAETHPKVASHHRSQLRSATN